MRYLLTIALFILLWPVFGQQTDGTVTIRNAELTVLSGTNIYIKGHLNDSTLGTQLTDGRDYEGAVSSAGNIYVGKGLFNKGEQKFNITQGRIIFNGTDIQPIGGNPVAFFDLELDKDTALVPYQFIEVTNALEMTRGYVNLDSIISGIDLGLMGRLVGEANEKRVFGKKGRLFARERNLSAATTNIGGLGLSTNGTLGLTDLERFNVAQSGATDRGSVFKYFSLIPNNKNVTLSSASMSYFDADIAGFDERIFALWNSTNQGVVWNRSVGNVNTTSNLVSGQNIRLGNDEEDLLTIADSVCTSGPVVSLHPTDVIAICDGESFELDAGNPGLFFLWNTGATTQQITVSAPGEYYVRVTDANGCYGTDTVEVIEKPFPVVSFNDNFADKFVCFGQESSFLNTTTLSDPSGSLTYEWELNDGNGIVTDENPTTLYANPGAYAVTLTATSDFNCVASATQTYTVLTLPQIAFQATEVCEGLATAFTNNSTAVDGIFGYNWDFGDQSVTSDQSTATDPTYTYPGADQYTVKLVGESLPGCKDSTEVVVNVKPVPLADFTAKDLCIGADIAIDNLSTISSGSLTYGWDFGDATNANVPFPPKTYNESGTYDITLTATSNLNCTAEITKSVAAFAIPDVSFRFNDQCEGESVTFTNESTIDSNEEMTFQWTFEDGRTSGNTDVIRTFSDPGDYTVTLVANTPNQCTAVTTRQINIFPVPVADFSVANVCLGEAVRPNNKSSIASGDVAFTWYVDGVERATGRNPSLNITEAGLHEITLEARSQNFCEDVITKEVVVHALPELDIPAQITTCGDQLTLDAGPDGTTYLWSDNSRGQTLTVTRDGTYEVTVTNAAGCTVTASTTVSLDSQFEPNLPPKIEACNEVILDAGNPGSLSYQWSTGSTSRFIEVTTSGLYTVDIIDQNGCPGAQEIEVVISPSPVLDLPESITACSGEEVLLDTGQPGPSHQWSNGETTSAIVPTISGRYSVIVTTPAGCSTSGGVDVIIDPSPTVDLGQDRVACDIIELDAGNSGSSYLWSDGSTNQVLSGTMSGEYWVEVTNAFGCTASDTVSLSVSDTPVLDLPENLSLCSGASVVLDAGNPDANFLWSTGEESQTIEASSTGVYSVTVTSAAGCSVSGTVDLFVAPRVEVDLGPDRSICRGSELMLTANLPDANYQWTSSEGVFSSDRTVVLNTADQYILEVETFAGCIGRDTINLRVSEDTLISRFLVTSEANVGDTLQFTSISVPSQANHFWRFGDGITSVKEDPRHIFFRAGVYDATLTVSKDGCLDTSGKSITIADPNSGRLEQISEVEEVNLFISPLIKDTLTSVNIYPNIFQDQFTISLDKARESPLLLLFHDLNGKLWYAEEFDKVRTLSRRYDWSIVPSGLYVISFITNEERITRKIIKQ